MQTGNAKNWVMHENRVMRENRIESNAAKHTHRTHTHKQTNSRAITNQIYNQPMMENTTVHGNYIKLL